MCAVEGAQSSLVITIWALKLKPQVRLKKGSTYIAFTGITSYKQNPNLRYKMRGNIPLTFMSTRKTPIWRGWVSVIKTSATAGAIVCDSRGGVEMRFCLQPAPIYNDVSPRNLVFEEGYERAEDCRRKVRVRKKRVGVSQRADTFNMELAPADMSSSLCCGDPW